MQGHPQPRLWGTTVLSSVHVVAGVAYANFLVCKASHAAHHGLSQLEDPSSPQHTHFCSEMCLRSLPRLGTDCSSCDPTASSDSHSIYCSLFSWLSMSIHEPLLLAVRGPLYLLSSDLSCHSRCFQHCRSSKVWCCSASQHNEFVHVEAVALASCVLCSVNDATLSSSLDCLL